MNIDPKPTSRMWRKSWAQRKGRRGSHHNVFRQNSSSFPDSLMKVSGPAPMALTAATNPRVSGWAAAFGPGPVAVDGEGEGEGDVAAGAGPPSSGAGLSKGRLITASTLAGGRPLGKHLNVVHGNSAPPPGRRPSLIEGQICSGRVRWRTRDAPAAAARGALTNTRRVSGFALKVNVDGWHLLHQRTTGTPI